MDNLIKDTAITRWLARIFIVLVIVFIIWWIFKKRRNNNADEEEYEYKGIKEYKITFLDKVFKYFKNQGQSHKKEKRVNKTEEMCRKIIEKIYKKPFPSCRPSFLKSPMTKKNLELDCYNKDLKIAIEYNGRQHYTYTPHFHKSKTNFYSQVHRDDWKRKKCKELGIRLIEVPYWIIPIDLENYIRNELIKKGCL